MLSTAALKGKQTGEAWGEGAQAGLAAIQHYGGAKPGNRTMLDALAPAIKTFQAKIGSGAYMPTDAAGSARPRLHILLLTVWHKRAQHLVDQGYLNQ